MSLDLQQLIKTEFKTVIEETFTLHHGMYTNRGTSLFETLGTISAETASRAWGREGETIAGHVFHVKFYLIVVQEYLVGARTGPTDWDESWVVKGVGETEWEALKGELKAEYDKLMAFIDGVEDWGKDDFFSGVLGIVAHNAFHLAAIRELNSIEAAGGVSGS